MPWDTLPTPPPAWPVDVVPRINGFDLGEGDSTSVYFLQTSNGRAVEIVGEIRNVAREGVTPPRQVPAPARRKIRF